MDVNWPRNCVYVNDIDEFNSIEKGKQPPKLLLVTLILLVYQDHDIVMYVSNTFFSWLPSKINKGFNSLRIYFHIHVTFLWIKSVDNNRSDLALYRTY